MQILQHHQQRPLGGERLEQSSRCPLHFFDRTALGVRGADCTEEQAGDQGALLVPGKLRT